MAKSRKFNLVAIKNTKVFCNGCNDLLWIFKRDVFINEMTNDSQIYPDKGQGFVNGDKFICKKCGKNVSKREAVTLKEP